MKKILTIAILPLLTLFLAGGFDTPDPEPVKPPSGNITGDIDLNHERIVIPSEPTSPDDTFEMNLWQSMISFSDMFTGPSGPTSIKNSYVGSWKRQAVYANGALMNNEPALLTFKIDGSYTSTGLCALSGTYKNNGNKMTLNVSSSNCEGPTPTPITYTYTIDEETNGMTTTTHYQGTIIQEKYSKVK